MKGKIRVNVGDVFQINLPTGKFAYGRVYQDALVKIYKKVTDEHNNPPIGSRNFLFQVGMYADLLTTGKLQIVGHDPFKSEEDSWGDPSCIQDPISNNYSIYHKGNIRDSTKEECEGLEKAAVWDLNHIIERIQS